MIKTTLSRVLYQCRYLAVLGGVALVGALAPNTHAQQRGPDSWVVTWPCTNNLNASVNYGGDLYGVSGGGKTIMEYVPISFGEEGNWSTVGDVSGGPENAAALCVQLNGEYLYVGGLFSSIGSIVATNIAKYNLVTGVWSAVGNDSLNPNSSVQAIVFDANGNLYVAAQNQDFEDWNLHGEVDPLMVQVWNGSSWSALGGGLTPPAAYAGPLDVALGQSPSSIRYGDAYQQLSLATDGVNVYVGGLFDGGYNGGTYIYSPSLIKWTGSAWAPMGGTPGMTSIFAYNLTGGSDWGEHIESMVVFGSQLIVAGQFYGPCSTTGGITSPGSPIGLAMFSTATGDLVTGPSTYNLCATSEGINGIPPAFQSPFDVWPGSGAGQSLATTTHAGTNCLYLTGCFDSLTNRYGTVPANSIALLSDDIWVALSQPGHPTQQGLQNQPWGGNDGTLPLGYGYSLAAGPSEVYVSGEFQTAGGMTVTNNPPVMWFTPILN